MSAPFTYPPLTEAELAEILHPVSMEDRLALAKQIPAWRRAEHPDRDDAGWVEAAGAHLPGAPSGLQCLLGWALGARGPTRIEHLGEGTWTLIDTEPAPPTRQGGIVRYSVSWTTGLQPPYRFQAERVDPLVARCPDELSFLHAACREVAAHPDH